MLSLGYRWGHKKTELIMQWLVGLLTHNLPRLPCEQNILVLLPHDSEEHILVLKLISCNSTLFAIGRRQMFAVFNMVTD